jgi:starch synthase (maltosyl-transferring)
MQRAAASGRRIAVSDLPEVAPSDPTGPRFRVEDIYPCIDGGRYPVKRIVGEPIEVWADVLREGHDRLAVELLWRKESERAWQREPMRLDGNDRWYGRFMPTEVGRYLFAIEAWTDQFATWRHGVTLKREAGLDVDLEAREGRELLGEIKARDPSIKRLLDQVRREFDRTSNLELLLADELVQAVATCDLRGDMTHSVTVPVMVDRPRARAGAWYEMVPRNVRRLHRAIAGYRGARFRRHLFAAHSSDRYHQP